MADLVNSQRALFKATYVPIRPKDGPSDGVARVMEKLAVLRQLNLQKTDFDQLAQDPQVQVMIVPLDELRENPFPGRVTVPLLELVQLLVTDVSTSAMERYAPVLRNVAPPMIQAFGEAVLRVRQATSTLAAAHLSKIEVTFSEAVASEAEGARGTFDAMRWAIDSNLDSARELLHLAGPHANVESIAARKSEPDELARAFVAHADDVVKCTKKILSGLIDRFHIEPVGRLHLERIEMTPIGIEHGELVHSVPLTPKETVNISHREWSETSTTFENLVQDYFEGYSEQGVAEKTELATATSNESRHASALDVNGSVTASYQGAGYSVTASAGVDYNTQSEDIRSVKESHAHSLAVTRNASTRTRKEHKTSFRVSSVAGTEDRSVRVLTNPSETKSMRVDYYQLMRKWRVDLIRYGLRMTYDIVVPNPGSDLAQKLAELRNLNLAISRDHSFDVALADITRTSWAKYAHDYAANLEPPPTYPRSMTQTKALEKTNGNFWTYGSVEFDLPDGYQIEHAKVQAHYQSAFGKDDNERPWFGMIAGPYQNEVPKGTDVGNYAYDLSAVGWAGKVSFVYMYYHVNSGEMLLTLDLVPQQSAMQAWQVRVWNQLREADRAAYEAALQRMRDRQKQLESEIGDFDALTLRKMEREEIMKCVLQWLLGPAFHLHPAELDWYLEDPQQRVFADQCNEAWQAIMLYGEFIKYIHNAIEWENVLYFPYPYFWDAVSRWPFKMFLMHPNPEHRTFLRAGCARVVLTVRPGFEKSFAAFMETGSFKDVLGDGHPYISISEEIRNFAMTNYEGIPPANPDKNARPLLFPEQRKAWSDMQKLMLLLEAYSAKNSPDPEHVKKYPTTADGLGVLAGLVPLKDSTGKVVVDEYPKADPWGKPYVYSSPGLRGDYDLVCYGRNGKEGGEGINADITSWAEGSVVATWFEYTPTSALDVAVNSALVTSPQPA